MVDSIKVGSIVDWLVAGAPPPKSIEELLLECSSRLIDAGVPLSACVVNGIFVHPQIRGIRYSWTREKGVRRRTFDHSFMKSPEFLETPLSKMIENPEEIRFHFSSGKTRVTSRFQRAYKDLGYSDVLILPLVNTDGSATGNIEFSTKDAGGFNGQQVEALNALRNPIARLKEYHTEHFDKKYVLESYVGREPCKKILSGKVSRGEGEVVTAVVLFADLSGFTQIADASNYESVLGTLNSFFGIVGQNVEKYQGEILKFIGDGVLVIYSSSFSRDAQKAAAQCALATVEDIKKEMEAQFPEKHLSFKSSLHVGEVFLGNIGTESRLDFTAIGPAVNLTARMLEEATKQGIKMICSAAFQDLLDDVETVAMERELRGFKKSQKVYQIRNYSIPATWKGFS